ncbi:MAG: cation:proton antiporter [Rickettsiales bacterium]
MFDVQTLKSILILFSVPICLVILFRKFYLSSVLAYLVSGVIIGNHGFNFVDHDKTGFIAEFGVVFLLFAIGLELSFERLKAMRKYVFGLGSMQILFTSIIFWFILNMFMDAKAAIIVAGGLALSSTAIVLKTLDDKNIQSTQTGRISLSILLQQDFTVVPLLVMLPILAGKGDINIGYALFIALIKAIIAMFSIFLMGRIFLRPAFRLIASESNHNNNEIFIATTILIALSAAYATESLGLSMALGAFLAGILVAETEFRVSAEESIFPFKDLLLGLFFMHVGMTINILDVIQEIKIVILGAISLMCIKTIIILLICKSFRFSTSISFGIGILLSQGSEFAFVLFNMGKEYGLIEPKIAKILLLIVTISMALTPLFNTIGDYIINKLYSNKLYKKNESSTLSDVDFGANDLNKHVIICGFGDIGKLIAKILFSEGISYIALDIDREIVKTNYKKYSVFRGDITQIDILKGAGIERCALIILAINNFSASKAAAKKISEHFPHIDIVVRALNLQEVQKYAKDDNLETVPSDCETALQISSIALKNYGINNARINNIINLIRQNKYKITEEVLVENTNRSDEII